MAASSSSPPPPPPHSSVTCMDGFTYDVFLSFRGKDTRYHFTSFLWKALEDKGIRTFFDKEDIRTGEEITKALPKAIEESRTAIVVLSPNYAESAFCLRELSHILHCIRGRGRVVWPVFYEVEPSDVRWSTGTYGKAMAEHEATSWYTPVQLQNWKNALQQVADLKGDRYYKWKNGINIYQYEFIDKIVKEVSKQIRPSTLFVTDYSVGLKQKREEVISLLNDEEVHMVGIHGLGGIGKTTLAKEVYNSISPQFEGSCFLEKVRENSKNLTSLQKTLLSKTVGEKEMNITSVPEGITVLQQRLRHKKILLLLDDVDNTEQLNAIIGTPSVATAGRPEWFGPGSRVIITTRDIGLLRSHGVENKYEVMGLNKEDALKLLRWKAFKSDDVISDYDGVLNRAVKYASGLPLALEVIGSHLFKRETNYWNYTLEQYERSPHERIQAVLEVSYKALNKEQQSAFLDIACFFNGHKLAWVKKILHAHHGNRAEGHIEVLVEKSLIKINESSNVTLHDLIEDMGKEIVQRDLQEEPGRRSRLWNRNDIVSVLQDNMGTSEIEVIYLYSKNEVIYFYSKNEVIRNWDENEVKWDGEAFKRTNKLRILIIHGGIHFSTSPTYLPNSLTVLKWDAYPSEHLPHDFYPKKLAICELWRNKLTSIGRGDLFQKANKFENMRVLNLNYSYHLKEIPNVSGLPNLEEFLFQECEELVTIDHSVGLLGKLKILRASGCSKLKSFPPLKLAFLEELDISDCESLESFPPVVDGLLDKLKILRATSCGKLKNFPVPLKLASLEELDISFCDSLESFPRVVDGLLDKLKILRATGCRKLKNFPVPLKLASLEKLDISYCNSLESFPPVVDGLLAKLKILYATCCKKLKNFPVPLKLASLKEFDISYCNSLESFPPVVDGLLDKLQIFCANKCGKLKNFPVPLKLASLEKLDISDCDSLESFPKILGEMENITQLQLEETPIKEWPFSFRNFTRLRRLSLSRCGITRLPSSIVMMSKLIELSIEDGEWVFQIQDKGEEKVNPMQSSQVELLHLRNSILSDESLAIGLKWFANVKELDLSGSKFTTLPECIEKCQFLWKLILKDCKELQEIKGIPPSLKYLFAVNCESLTLSSKSKLLNRERERHESGNTRFCLPGSEIPEWFEHQCMQGESFSFWFRNKFPVIALSVVSQLTWDNSDPPVTLDIIGPAGAHLYVDMDSCKYNNVTPLKTPHLHFFRIQTKNFYHHLYKALLENRWHRAEVDFASPFQKRGFHLWKEKCNMENIRFTSPENDVNTELTL